MDLADDENPSITQPWSMLSNALNPYTETLLHYVTVIIDRILFEMDRESLYDVNAWTHEFTELALSKLMYGLCDGSYPFCSCERDCGVTILQVGEDGVIQLPICHFVTSVVTTSNLPNETGGFEKVSGDRVWDMAIEYSKNVKSTNHPTSL